MRWLHISDLHIDSSCDPEDSYGFFHSFFDGLKERVSNKHVEFIIFTGDLFNHGKWNKGQKDAALKFLQKVYNVCKESCGWNADGDRMVRLFYCPGNHDVFRSAFCNEGDFVLLRSNLLESIRDNPSPVVRNGYFCDEEGGISVERKVLTECTFSLFDDAMKNFGAYSTNGNDGRHHYEYRKYTHHAVLPTSPVVALNTALLAGQIYSQDTVSQELGEAWDEFQKAHAKFDFRTAKKQYDRYQSAYLKQQGLLRDDEGHMCFISRNAANDLKDSLTGCRYPILFGHHPISSYSEEAQEAFYRFARDVHAHIYLCGHAHKPKGEKYDHGVKMNHHEVFEITVGGIFVDGSGYNEASFAIEELKDDGNNDASFNVSIFTHIGEDEDQFGFDQWTERTWKYDRLPMSIRTNPAVPTVKNTTPGLDKDKVVKNEDKSGLDEVKNDGKDTAAKQEPDDGYHIDGEIREAFLRWLNI